MLDSCKREALVVAHSAASCCLSHPQALVKDPPTRNQLLLNSRVRFDVAYSYGGGILRARQVCAVEEEALDLVEPANVHNLL